MKGQVSIGDTLTFRAEINNRDAEDKNYIMFIVYCSNERIIKVENKNVNISASESGIVVKEFDSVVPDGENVEIKCMLFSDSVKIRPEAEMIYR